MNTEPEDLVVLRLHKTWADRYTLLWQVLIFVLFAGIYFLMEQMAVASAERASALILLAVMVLTAAIWQAVGLGLARIHLLMKGVDLERGPPRAIGGVIVLRFGRFEVVASIARPLAGR